jgi:hypothetical protein
MQAWDIKTQLKAEIRQDLLDTEMRIKCAERQSDSAHHMLRTQLPLARVCITDHTTSWLTGTRSVACGSADDAAGVFILRSQATMHSYYRLVPQVI